MSDDSAAAAPGARHWLLRALAWVTGLALALPVVALLVVGIALAVAYPNLPGIDSLTDYRPKLPLRIFTADGVLIGEFGEERRHFTPIERIPPVMKQAVLAAEDARFYEHPGVDFKGVARAALENLRDARSQGASTITMQVARNFYLSTEKTFTRKIYEILLALQMESRLGKDQILELYMNQIYLGQRAHGFAAAAEIYFGKPLDALSLAEAAMLAGLPKAPSAYNPFANPKRALARQRYVVDRMLEAGFVTAEQHAAALAEELRYREPPPDPLHAEHAAEMARQLVHAQYGDEAYTRGLEVHLSIDSRLQRAAHAALRRGLLVYEQRQYYRGPEAVVDLPTDPSALDARVVEVLADHPDEQELRAAVVLEASTREVRAVLHSGETITVRGSGLQPVRSGLAANAAPQVRIRRGAVVRALQDDKGQWLLTQQPEVEGALVALDPRSGALRALVGGFDFGRNKFNNATQAQRQPGSAFKPFIYSAALEKGFGPGTIVYDGPLYFDASFTGDKPWEPKNYDGEFEGPMPLALGLAKSKNMVSIRVLQSIGPDYAQGWITRFGFEPARHPPYLTMALGAGSVTPLQMASAYAVFANGGHLLAPRLIERITDQQGHTLVEAAPPQTSESTRTISARNAFVMSSLMQEITRSGTAAAAQRALRRVDLYGKTGTTNDSVDAWFAGYQPTMVGVVWVGHSTPRKLGSRETGGRLALPVWIDFMRDALASVPVAPIDAPPGVVQEEGGWVFEEFAGGAGVRSVGLDEMLPEPPTPEERGGILDLFRR